MVVTPPGGKKLKKKWFFAAHKAAQKILSTFFEISGKFVNKNAIKSEFRGGLGGYISKNSKNAHFFEVFEIHLPRPPPYSTSTKVPRPPPKK